ncbi:uncharacterized protein LOC106151404 [Lingula anatina]|uniref:Uncharacterized protein LOC106151404 n=1 Tax=Lingula anatina TaxID=7574 RepID=A0A1S3H2D5_LINAN|nr:uncharacterized protein LOC106151404 [Lingula anatina]|eukprot:XP_013380102.1 uncharacterized protein LOC106151404 [Lingula anatina]
MLASARPEQSVNHALLGSVHTLKHDVNDVLRSGQYYVTDELARKAYDIDNSLNHLKFDQNLLATSKEWKQGFDQDKLMQEHMGATHAGQHVQQAFFDLKNSMSGKALDGKQENEIREAHHWADKTLEASQEALSPYALNAHNRIQQFSDHIGVTDRFNGYRHMLTRGSRDPVVLGMSWLDTKRNAYNSSLNVGWRANHPSSGQQMSYGAVPGNQRGYSTDKGHIGARELHQTYMGTNKSLQRRVGSTGGERQTSGTMDHLQAYNTTMITANGPKTQSVQESCGINMTFPGKTEYMVRYKRPPLDPKTSDFLINPTPNFMASGRPLMKGQYESSFTEYQTRFEWPDSRKIVKLPWLRK